MSRVYSTTLIRGQDDGTGNLAYTAGEGLVVVIRDIVWLSQNPAPQGIYGEDDTGIVIVDGPGVASPFGGTLGHWSGRQVMDAGDTIGFSTADSSTQLTVMGYVLTA